MSLLGQVDFGGTLTGSMPSGLLCMIGEDGQHYATATVGANIINVACAETNSYFSVTYDKWANDFDLLGFGGNVGHHYAVTHTIPVPGTPYFFACGWGDDGVDAIVIVRYKIVSFGVVSLDGGYRYLCGHTMPPGFEFAAGQYGSFRSNSHSWGSAVINGKSYSVNDTGGNLFAFSQTFKIHLVQLSLSGSEDDSTYGSWDNHIIELPWDWNTFRSGTGRDYRDRACLINLSSGIQVIQYRGIGENGSAGASQVLSTLVDVLSMTAGASTDVSAAWGVPFSDCGYLKSGSFSGDARNDYTSPYQGDNGVVYWARSFTDDHTYVRTRQYTIDNTGAPVAGTTNTFVWTSQSIPAGLNQTLDGIYTFHQQPELLYMARAQTAYIFGSRTVDSASSGAGQSRIIGF